ncbi:hypothetical protein F5887DRAFT_1078160 [Amanita rubescens]|nr:hypothetical protein F5887DRAFT_1078160 [Amanita rubescens]
MPFIFILKKPNATTVRLVSFDERPSWEVLALTIAEDFSISPNDVSVIFPPDSNGDITVEKEGNLQSFYEVYNPPSGKFKGIVQDLQAPDPQDAITSTWSMGSDLSNLSNSDDQLKLFCWVLNVSDDPFHVIIGKSLTVSELKKEIKKEMQHAVGAIDPDTLELWKLSPPISSADIDTKFKDVQSPQWIPGCVKLKAMDKLSEHFSSAPRKHLHIIVEVPPTRKYSQNPS